MKMKLTKLINEMMIKLEEANQEAYKFEDKGNNASSTRLRKAMQEIKAMANDVRSIVMDIRNERKK